MRTDWITSNTTLPLMGPVPGQGTLGLSYAFGSTPRTRTSPPPTQLPTVRQVMPGTPAARAGVREGDVIVSVNGRDGRAPFIFPDHAPGTVYSLRIRRAGAERDVRLVTGPPPSRAEAERHMALEAACSLRERAPSSACMFPY
jgi:membrane-associated protease RseP (regulator of RpoE activity)